MKKILQIEPWIDNAEANYLKKIVNKTFLTEGNETKNLKKNLSQNIRQNMLLQYQID